MCQRLASASGSRRHLAAELEKIDGTYSFILGSLSRAHVHLVTDPIGRLHVYTLTLAEDVFLSTSALLLAQIGQCRWNMLGVREFLANGTVFEDRSLFSGVHKLTPGSILTFDNNLEANRQIFWSVRDHVDFPRTNEQSLEHYKEAVITGLKGIFKTYNAPVLDLTGGFDSRIILACARQACPDNNYDTAVVGSPDHPDVTAANRIASQLHLRHHQIARQPQTAQHWLSLAQAALPLVDGEYDILEYARILNVHCQLASQFGISLNGSGGELIRGYWWELLFPRTGQRNSLDIRRIARHRFATDHWAETLLGTQFSNTLLEHFTAALTRASSDLTKHRNTACLDNIYLMLRMQRWQGRIASATNHNWPCLSPLAFRRSFEIAVSAPIALRRNGRMARRLLAGIDRELAGLPMENGYPATPIPLHAWPHFLSRRTLNTSKDALKRRLSQRNMRRTEPTPVQQLLAQDEALDMLDPAQMLTAELYDSHQLRSINQAIKNHCAPDAHIGRLFTLESTARLRSRLSMASSKGACKYATGE